MFSADFAVETSLVEEPSSGEHLLGLVHKPAAPLTRVLVARAGFDPETLKTIFLIEELLFNIYQRHLRR